MNDKSNKHEPEKRTSNAINQGAHKPTARKASKPQANQKSIPTKKTLNSNEQATNAASTKPVNTPRVSKAQGQTRQNVSFGPMKNNKSARTTKVPRTTTASKISKSGGKPSAIGHRYVASSSWSTNSDNKTGQTQVMQTQQNTLNPHSRSGTNQRSSAGKFSRMASVPSKDGVSKTHAVPQTRTPGSANEFMAFTRAHPKLMIPIFALVTILVLYTIVDITASFGKIHPGVSVQGVDVGGMTVEDASTKINEQLSPILGNARVTIYEDKDISTADGTEVSESLLQKAYADENLGTDLNTDGKISSWNLTAETVGAYINGEQLAQDAYLVGRKGNFVAERFFSWFGGTKLPATVSVIDERFSSLMTEINGDIGAPIVDSSIKIKDGKVSAVDGSDGISVDNPAFLKRFATCVFTSDNPAFAIPMKVDYMRIKPATAQKVASDVRAAIAKDVTIVHDKDTWVLNTADLGNLIGQQVLAPGEILTFGKGTQKVVVDDDTVKAPYDTASWVDAETGYILQAFVNQEKFDQYLCGILGPLATGGAKDAYFDTSSGEVVIVESVSGYGPDRYTAELALQTLLFGNPDPSIASSRTITLIDGTIEPNLTTDGAKAMGITERLATWSIPLSGSSQRIANIKLLCSLINNSIVAPGQTWSFNATTGERTAEKGFQTAPVIINGKHEDQLGGGICQVATCIFNAACYSGVGIQERVNHDFYIADYDDFGFADATVSWKTPDFKWLNDMSTHILMTAVTTDENVVVTFWGTKDGRTVECQRGEWREGAKFAQLTEVDPTLAPGETKITQKGADGRSIDVRYIATAADGKVLHNVVFHSIYSAQNEITAVGPAIPEAAPEASATPEATP